MEKAMADAMEMAKKTFKEGKKKEKAQKNKKQIILFYHNNLFKEMGVFR